MKTNAIVILTVIVLIVIVLAVLAVMSLYTNTTITTITKSDRDKIERLVRQTARWATAANQDTNPYITNLHATYAMGYLMALREIYPDTVIKEVSGVDIGRLDREINNTMDLALTQLSIVCPTGQPKTQFLAEIAKEGGVFR